MDNKVALLIVLGTIGVMLMSFSVVYFILLYRRRVLQNQLALQEAKHKHQKDMLHATLTSQEVERNRLGMELHDSVGGMLATIKMNLQVTTRKLQIEEIATVFEYLDETIGQVRDISHQMMPIVLKKYGLKSALTDLFEKNSHDHLSIVIVQWENFSLSEAHALLLYRIFQELLTNTLKHSGAQNISVSANRTPDSTLCLLFKDDGCGFPKEIIKDDAGMGLLNIKNRIQAMDATVTFSNHELGGAQVNLVLAPPIH